MMGRKTRNPPKQNLTLAPYYALKHNPRSTARPSAGIRVRSRSRTLEVLGVRPITGIGPGRHETDRAVYNGEALYLELVAHRQLYAVLPGKRER
jgi:hypothetical protein